MRRALAALQRRGDPARRQRDDAELDTLEADGASIRWITSARPAFDGYGPSVADPRSGEILDADIVIDGRVAQLTQGLRRDAEVGGPRCSAIAASKPTSAPGCTNPQRSTNSRPLPPAYRAWNAFFATSR